MGATCLACTTASLAALRIVADVYSGRARADGTPAILHPIAVWHELLEARIADPELHAAALLHDVLEDDPLFAPTWEARIRRDVGARVLDIVVALTDPPGLSTIDRRAAQLARMARAPQDVRQVKLADRLANLREPKPNRDSVHCLFYAAHTRALLAVMRRTHPVLEAAVARRLDSAPWC
jgi:GTP pyrophosphokinase